MPIVPEAQKHQSRKDAEELLDLDATRSDARAAEESEEAPAPKAPTPKEKIGMGEAAFDNVNAARLSMLRAKRDLFEAEGNDEVVAKLQAQINAIVSENQTTDSNNE